jgi:predicted glycosyltransferase
MLNYHEIEETGRRKIRIALYSPGIVGLGHLRRNLVISQVLAESDLQPVNLMVTEAREASAFVNCMPPGMDCITLPGLSKGVDGVCKPRYIDLPLKEVLSLRARIIRAALKKFEPDLFIVDNLPRGAYRELDLTLKKLASNGRTRCVLGLRDVLDEPSAVRRDWSRWNYQKAIRRYFDAIWVYGDPKLYDMRKEYNFPYDVAEKVRFMGYLDQRRRMDLCDRKHVASVDALALPPGRLILCLLGGGQDGEALASAFARARIPTDAVGLIVTGPFMATDVRERLQQCAHSNPRMRVVSFITEPTLLVQRAERIIAMGGYNTVCEVLSFEKLALIVPRTRPRREQIIRAERLRKLGLIEMLEFEQLTPQALTEWMARSLPPVRARSVLNFKGLERLPALAHELLAAPLLAESVA